jgi:hypothetical protein
MFCLKIDLNLNMPKIFDKLVPDDIVKMVVVGFGVKGS